MTKQNNNWQDDFREKVKMVEQAETYIDQNFIHRKKLESEIEKLGTPIEMEDLKGQIKDKHHYVRVKHVNALLMKRTQDIKNRLL